MGYKHIDVEFMETFYDGNDEFKVKMISMFMEKSPIYMNEINEHLGQQNWRDLSALAHKFKASIDFVGARNLKELVNEIEKSAKEGNVELITSLVASVNSIWNEVLIELQSELSTIKSEWVIKCNFNFCA